MDKILGIIFSSIIIFSFFLVLLSKKSVDNVAEDRLNLEETLRGKIGFIYRLIGFWIYSIGDIVKIYKIKPTWLTFFSLFFSVLSVIPIILNFFSVAGFLIAISGFFDAYDGYSARKIWGVTKKGAFSDSVLDRLGEIFIFSAISFSFRNNYYLSFITFLSLVFSILVSYQRARAEALGIDIKDGILRRQERIFLISLSFLLDSIFSLSLVKFTIFSIFIFSVITSFERFIKVSKKLDQND